MSVGKDFIFMANDETTGQKMNFTFYYGDQVEDGYFTWL